MTSETSIPDPPTTAQPPTTDPSPTTTVPPIVGPGWVDLPTADTDSCLVDGVAYPEFVYSAAVGLDPVGVSDFMVQGCIPISMLPPPAPSTTVASVAVVDPVGVPGGELPATGVSSLVLDDVAAVFVAGGVLAWFAARSGGRAADERYDRDIARGGGS